MIDRLAGQIAFQDSDLADAIIRLSRRFEHDRILAAIQSARSSEES